MNTKTIHGVDLIIPNDAVVMRYKAEGRFEDESIDLWRSLLSKDKLAIDVGAYTGLYSIIAAQAGAPVLAIEPNPSAVDRLHENAAINGVDIDVNQIALSDRPGPINLHLKGNRPLTSAASTVSTHGVTPFEVQSTTLDDLNLDLPVGVIKIDAERAEHIILRGASNLIERDRPVIITECLDGYTTLKLVEVLQSHSYVWCALEPCMIAWRPAGDDEFSGSNQRLQKPKRKKRGRKK